MKIRPLHDRILVQPILEKEVRKGGIIIPDSAKEKPIEGRIGQYLDIHAGRVEAVGRSGFDRPGPPPFASPRSAVDRAITCGFNGKVLVEGRRFGCQPIHRRRQQRLTSAETAQPGIPVIQ